MKCKYEEENMKIVASEEFSCADASLMLNRFIEGLRSLAHDILLQDEDVEKADKIVDYIRDNANLSKLMPIMAIEAETIRNSSMSQTFEIAFRNAMAEMFIEKEREFKNLVGDDFSSDEIIMRSPWYEDSVD